MSLSKAVTGAAAEQPRQPKCARCRHHGIIVPQKGHAKFCPFLKCDCWRCCLITQRARITTLQRKLTRAQDKEQRALTNTGISLVKPAETCCVPSAPDGGARPPATSGQMSPPSGGTVERAANTARSPLDLRTRRAAGGETVVGLNMGMVLPFASSEDGPCTPFHVPYFADCGQTAPLPVIQLPFRIPGQFPASYSPCPNFLLNMPWLPPVPAGLYSDGLPGPLMFSHLQSDAVHYPPPPEPGPPVYCRDVFFSLQPPPPPDPPQEELMSQQPPLSKPPKQETQELD